MPRSARVNMIWDEGLRVPPQALPPHMSYAPLDPMGVHATQERVAAVLMIFGMGADDSEMAHVVLTKRTATVKTHKGQIGFPGGHTEKDDASLIHTALREANEEIGIPPQQLAVHGAFPVVRTPDGKAVYPFWASTDFPLEQLAANPDEVQDIILVPWSALLRRVAEHHDFKIFGVARATDLFRYHQHLIWGLTARIIVSADLAT